MRIIALRSAREFKWPEVFGRDTEQAIISMREPRFHLERNVTKHASRT